MPSWKETLRTWLKPAPKQPARRAPRLEVNHLEDRITPVAGSFDVPYPVDNDAVVGATNLTGVVNIRSAGGVNSTGALIDRGADVVGSRHVLTAASTNPQVGSTVSFYSRAADGTVKTIDIPVTAVWIHPLYNAGTRANDIAVLTLAAVAPQYAQDYVPYNAQLYGSEISRIFTLAGYGNAGTGTSGEAFADLQRLSITATGGTYRLQSPSNGLTTAPIPYNATAAQVQAALAAINQVVTVTAPQFGPFVTIPNQFYSYEILYPPLTANAREFQYVRDLVNPLVSGGKNGIVDIQTLTNGANEGEYQRLTINGTAGTFRLGLGGVFTGQLPFNADERAIQTALETIPGVTEVTVRKIPAGSPSGAGSFQISFNQPNNGFPVLTVDTSTMTGTASAYILQNQGRPLLRIGSNEYDSVSGTFLTSDFDTDGTDSGYTSTDNGAPGLVDVGGGRLAIAGVASIVAAGNTKFTSIEQSTLVSKYNSDIAAQTNATGYAATIDMQYQLGGNDGIPDTFRVTQTADGYVQVYVKDSKNGPERLFYQDAAANMASVVLRGTNDDDTFIVDSSVTVLVSIEGGGGKNAVVGPNIDTMWTINGADSGTGHTSANDINFKGVRQIQGGTANDNFVFATGGTLSGFVDGGAGIDTVDFSGLAASKITVSGTGTIDGAVGTIATSVPLGGQFRNINNIVGALYGTADNLTGPPNGGTWTHAGVGGSYVDGVNGKSFTYSNFEGLTGGTGNDTFHLLSFGTALTVDGGAGVNAATVDGTAGNDSVVMDYLSDAGNGRLSGLPQPLTFSNLFSVDFDGKAGSNAYRFEDQSGTARGTPTDPASGIIYAPSGAAAGTIRVAAANSFGLAGITNGLIVDGGGSGSTLLALGTSGTGIQSAFGEAVIGDGHDTVTVTDTSISVTNSSAGALLAVQPAYTLGSITFSTIYVATGNESLNVGDLITVTPSYNVNLIVDGQGPANTARPGDRVVINSPAGYTSAFVNNPTLGPPQTRITQGVDGSEVGLINIETGVPATPGQGMIAVASDAGPVTTVQVYDKVSRTLRFEVQPFGDFTLGASVASGDVNGDGIADLIVGAGAGGGPRVAVFNGIDGSLIYDFMAYEDTFRGGVNVSAADFNGDGRADLVLGTGVGGGPRVRVFNSTDLSPISDVLVYEATFRGGVNVSTGDFNADGVPDLITSAGAGGGPRVVVFSGNSFLQLASFFVFDPNSRTGFYAAGGDVNGDGFADVIAGAGAGDPAHVRVISGALRTPIADFYVNDPLEPGTAIPSIQFDAGVRVAAVDLNGDGIDDVLTAKGPGSQPTIRGYQVGAVNPVTNALYPTLAEVAHFDAFSGDFSYGLYVGGSN